MVSLHTQTHDVTEDELVLEPYEVAPERTTPTAPAKWLQDIPPPLPTHSPEDD